MKASDYKKHAQKHQKLETVPLPSGKSFIMRLAPIQQWVTTGILPASLAGKMQIAARAKDKNKAAAAVLESFTEEDYAKQQELSRKLLEFCCVEPRISIDGSDAEALAPADLLPEDFEFLVEWCWSGGEAGKSLATFRAQAQDA
jgi:hypothetical protein